MNLIFNDQTQVLTTFDMNQIASFTFNSKVCTEIFECIDYALTHPIEFTVLSLTKTLVLVHHLAIYASPQAANQVWMLKADIELLTQYNTVLYALKDKQSILAKMNRIKGGSVDRGLPVREAALQIHHLLQDITLFRQLRNQSKDPDSLVPIGSKEQVGFVSDEVRQGILEDKIKMEELERKKHTSSSVFQGVSEKSLQVGGESCLNHVCSAPLSIVTMGHERRHTGFTTTTPMSHNMKSIRALHILCRWRIRCWTRKHKRDSQRGCRGRIYHGRHDTYCHESK